MTVPFNTEFERLLHKTRRPSGVTGSIAYFRWRNN